MIVKVVLGTMQKARKLVSIAESIPYDVELCDGHYVVDAKSMLGVLGLSGFFDAVSDGNNITKSKPDPQVFAMAAQMLGLTPEKCLVVEDALAGIQAAEAGGFDSAGIGLAGASGTAAYSLSRFSDLLKLV